MKQLKQGFIIVPGQGGQSWSAFPNIKTFPLFFSPTIMNNTVICLLQCIFRYFNQDPSILRNRSQPWLA